MKNEGDHVAAGTVVIIVWGCSYWWDKPQQPTDCNPNLYLWLLGSL